MSIPIYRQLSVDLRLGDESAIPILQRLAYRHLPFVVHTGYVADEVQREWPVAPIIQKPATPGRIAEALAHSLRPLTAPDLTRGFPDITETSSVA